MSSPVFDLTNYVTGTPTSAPITKANFQAITDWATTTKLDNSNLQYPHHNVTWCTSFLGQLNAGTYYSYFAIPPTQLAWVPLQAQLGCFDVNATVTTANFQVYVSGAWTNIMPIPLTAASDMPTVTTAFSAPYSGGIAAGMQLRCVLTISAAHVDNLNATLLFKAYHIP